MRIACVGGGPAGLYFSLLMKLDDPRHDVVVLERNARGLTYGWGVVFWSGLLERLYAKDQASADAVRSAAVRWVDQLVERPGSRSVRLGGHGYSIGRRTLLDILSERATALGVEVRYEHEVDTRSDFADADLIVAADGVNSRVRASHADRFQTTVSLGRNKYLWLGTRKQFDAFTFPFVETEAGWIWMHAYRFDEETSTCVVECLPETWHGLGLDSLGRDATLELLSRLFEPYLEGHALLDQPGASAAWLNFRTLRNEHWHWDNTVLLGDAAHTTHFTIGSGTELALEDAICLAEKLAQRGDLRTALTDYETERRRAVQTSVSEASNSARWFEQLPRYACLNDREFAALLGRRRSPLQRRMPPRWYYQLDRVTEDSGPLRLARRGYGSVKRALGTSR